MQCLRGTFSALLCVSLLSPPYPGLSEAAKPPSLSPSCESCSKRLGKDQLGRDQRILHALNRFTFGPRPGDFEAVRAEGLERWFEQQLHPASLDRTTLNARLAQYPAMRLDTEDLLARFPSNALIRQAIDGKFEPPGTGVARAIYQDQMYRVTTRRQNKQQKQQTGTNPDVQAGTSTTNESAPLSSNAYQAQSGRPNALSAPRPGTDDGAMDTADDVDGAALVPSVLEMPPSQRMIHLAALQPAQATAFFRSVRGPDREALSAGLTPEQRENLAALENPQRTVIDELIGERLTRDIYSTAQLQEVVTDFWLNHFNVFLHKNDVTPYELVSYERDVIRPRALGKFEDLLEATAHSPAMLLYLDNASSTGPDSLAAQRAKNSDMRNGPAPKKAREGLNENYARELMELHTLGVNGGYTQADVTQVARILTGWTVDRPQRGGGFRFEPNRHQPGAKKVMGKKFNEDGEQEGRDLLHFLATRPATARFISRKLAVRFVSDDPPASLVNRMAGTYLASGGDISAVLKTMFHSPEFWSPSVYRAKVKTPLEYVVSAVRASNADITRMPPLANALRDMGMPLFGAVPPTGYKWDAADWVSTGALVARMNFALTLAADRVPGSAVRWSVSGSNPENPADAEEARLEQSLVPEGVSSSTRSAVLEQFAAQTNNVASTSSSPQQLPVGQFKPQGHSGLVSPLERQDQLLAGLLLGSPEFQRR